MAVWKDDPKHGDTVLPPKAPVVKKPTPPAPKVPSVGDAYSVVPPAVYDLNLPTWTLGSGNTSYKQEVSTGYDVIATRGAQARHDYAMLFANGSLSDKTTKYQFMVVDVNIDWAIAGKIAQSRFTRDMYPHNMVQPAFVVKGISRDQQDYGELVEYIHQMQHDALNGGRLIQLNIVPGQIATGTRPATIAGHPTKGVRTQSQEVSVGNVNAVNQTIRGTHLPITAQGYVKSVTRQHRKGAYVPSWEFDFIVAAMLAGPYSEDLVTIQKQKNWADVVMSVSLFDTTALVAGDNKTLDAIQQDSANVFHYDAPVALSTGSGSGGGGGGGTGGGTTTISASANLTVKGAPATARNRHSAQILLDAASANNAPALAMTAVMIAGIWESGMGVDNTWNPTYGGLLAGNVGTFGSLGSADSDAVAKAEAHAFFVGGQGYNSANSHASNYSNAVDLAQFVEGCDDQYRAESGYPGDTAAIAEAQAWVNAASSPNISSSGGSTSGKTYAQLNESGIASWSGHGSYHQASVPMCKWIINELNWGLDNGWHPTKDVTSGYSNGTGHAAGSEHYKTAYPGGAIDFGGPVSPSGYATKKALIDLATRLNYPGPRLLMPTFTGYNSQAIGTADDGHCSGNGH